MYLETIQAIHEKPTAIIILNGKNKTKQNKTNKNLKAFHLRSGARMPNSHHFYSHSTGILVREIGQEKRIQIKEEVDISLFAGDRIFYVETLTPQDIKFCKVATQNIRNHL